MAMVDFQLWQLFSYFWILKFHFHLLCAEGMLLLACFPAGLCTWQQTGSQEQGAGQVIGQGGAEQPQRDGADPGTMLSQGFGTAHATAQTLL